MKNVVLPAILKPISRRADKSVMLKFDSREFDPEELLSIMALEGVEGWIQFSPNQEFNDVPEENAKVSDLKSPSARLKAALYRVYMEETKNGKYIGLFQSYYDDKMEKFIQHTLSRLDK